MFPDFNFPFLPTTCEEAPRLSESENKKGSKRPRKNFLGERAKTRKKRQNKEDERTINRKQNWFYDTGLCGVIENDRDGVRVA